MKLALAIVVCIYFCAVNAMQTGQSAFDVYPGYEEFLANFDIFERLFCDAGYENLSKDEQGYGESLEILQGSKKFSKIVNRIYQRSILVKSQKHVPNLGKGTSRPKFNLKSKSWCHLEKVDLAFKLKCIVALRTELGLNAVRSNCCSPDLETPAVAYKALEDVIQTFTDILSKSLIDENDQNSFEFFWTKYDFLRFLGFWFQPDCGENAMKKAIEDMKEGTNLNDIAAKVKVLLRKFPQEGINESYLPTLHTKKSSN